MDLPEEKSRVIRAVVREIEKVPDALARGEYLRQAGERLGVDEDDAPEHRRAREPREGPQGRHHPSPRPKRGSSRSSSRTRRSPRISSRRSGTGISGGFESEPVFGFIRNCFRNGVDWNFADLKDAVDARVLDSLSQALQETARQPPPSSTPATA